MKVFLVFLGLLVVNVNFLVYQGDVGRYVHGQAVIKQVAEECAAGAALLLEEEAYAEGAVVFDKAAGQKYADEHLEYMMKSLDKEGNAYYRCTLSFEDDSCGYSSENQGNIPKVTAHIKVKTENFFRLPMFHLDQYERKAQYELIR